MSSSFPRSCRTSIRTSGKALTRQLKKLKIKLYLNHRAESFEAGDPSIVVARGPKDEELRLEADVVMMSVGRVPNTENLNLEAAGVAADDKGFITVNDRMQTSAPGIYAIGDVVGGALLAHKAYQEAKVAAEVIAGEPAAFDSVVPAVIYTDPEVAWAGLGEEEAREKGYDVVTGSFQFKASGRAMSLDATDGFVKAIADAGTKQLLGSSQSAAGSASSSVRPRSLSRWAPSSRTSPSPSIRTQRCPRHSRKPSKPLLGRLCTANK